MKPEVNPLIGISLYKGSLENTRDKYGSEGGKIHPEILKHLLFLLRLVAKEVRFNYNSDPGAATICYSAVSDALTSMGADDRTKAFFAINDDVCDTAYVTSIDVILYDDVNCDPIGTCCSYEGKNINVEAHPETLEDFVESFGFSFQIQDAKSGTMKCYLVSDYNQISLTFSTFNKVLSRDGYVNTYELVELDQNLLTSMMLWKQEMIDSQRFLSTAGIKIVMGYNFYWC